jgi:hypothetical protein
MPRTDRRRMSLAGATALALLFTFANALPSTAAVDVPAVQTANTPLEQTFSQFFGANSNGTIGWSFSVVGTDITVTSLGLYDSGGNGLADAHAVGLWTSGGTLLASATIPSGSGATLLGGYRYVAIAPVPLSAGQSYVIGALYPTQSGDNIIFNSTQTYVAPVSFGQSRQTGLNLTGTDPLTFPALNASLPQGIFGPNFLCSYQEPTPTINGTWGRVKSLYR